VTLALALFPLTTPTTMLLVSGVSPEIPWMLVGASWSASRWFALSRRGRRTTHLPPTVLLYGVRPAEQCSKAVRRRTDQDE